MQSQPDTRPSRRNMPTDEEISNFLIIISVIAKRLAGLIMKEGERQDEQNEYLDDIMPTLYKIVTKLQKCCETKKRIIVSYNSPHSGIKDIEMITQKLLYHNNKLYLRAKGLEYK